MQKILNKNWKCNLGLVIAKSLFSPCLNPKLLGILILSTSTLLGGTNLQALAEDSTEAKTSESSNPSSEFYTSTVPVAELNNLELNSGSHNKTLVNKWDEQLSTLKIDSYNPIELDSLQIASEVASSKQEDSPWDIEQGLNNLKAKDLLLTQDTQDPSNGGLNQPLLDNTETPKPGENPNQQPTNQQLPPPKPDYSLDNIQIDSSYKLSNYKIYLFELLSTAQYRLSNNNKLSFRVGYNSINSDRVTAGQPEDATVIPVRLGWEGAFDNYRLNLQAGATYYNIDPYPDALGADAAINYAALPNLFLGFRAEHGPMRYAPSTLAQPEKTTNTQLGPNLYWQIDPRTSFASLYSVSYFNNANRAQLTFSKLKRDIGPFYVGGTLVTFSYDRETPDAFFSPPDYLIYTGEVGVQTNLNNFLNLRLQLNYGEQRYKGVFTEALYYEIQLTSQINKNVDGFIKYSYGDLQNSPVVNPFLTGSFYREYYWVSQLRYKF